MRPTLLFALFCVTFARLAAACVEAAPLLLQQWQCDAAQQWRAAARHAAIAAADATAAASCTPRTGHHPAGRS